MFRKRLRLKYRDVSMKMPAALDKKGEKDVVEKTMEKVVEKDERAMAMKK